MSMARIETCARTHPGRSTAVPEGVPMLCPRCEADNPRGMKFCIGCAAPLTRRCPQCDVANLPRAKFCAQCATALTGQTPTPHSSLAPHPPLCYTPGHLAARIDRLPPEEKRLPQTAVDLRLDLRSALVPSGDLDRVLALLREVTAVPVH
jgi:Double zinc ribbon